MVDMKHRRRGPLPADGAPATNDKKSRQNRLATIIFALTISALVVLMIVAYITRTEPINKFGCAVGAAVQDAHTIVLIDQTDRLSDEELVYVKALILREYLLLNIHDRFTIRGLKAPGGADETQANTPHLSRCRVQVGSEADPFTQSALIIDERFKKLVGSGLAAVIDGLRNVPRSDTSPLIETIDSLTGGVEFSSTEQKRRLVIVSDMVQNTARLSQYRPDGQSFVFDPANVPGAKYSLAGMQVRVHYVVRDDLKNVQTFDHRRFWTAYFNGSGAKDVQIGWGLPPDSHKTGKEITELPEPPIENGSEGSPTETPQGTPSLPADTLPAPRVATPIEPPMSGSISVSGVFSRRPTSAQEYMRYEIRWPQAEPKESLVFDAGRVLLLALTKPAGCYLTIPVATRLARNPPGTRVRSGIRVRWLRLNEQSEREFAQQLSMKVGASLGSVRICEAVGARVTNTKNSYAPYRAVRCEGEGFQAIAEEDWQQIAAATRVPDRGGLGVVLGRHQMTHADLDLIESSLNEQGLCTSASDISSMEKITLGFRWWRGS